MSIRVCHFLYVTSCMSLLLCHFFYVTSSMSLPLCHFLYVTSSMSLPLCHFLYVTSSMSLPLCHFLYVTSSMSLPLCHFLYVTSSMSLPLCHFLYVTSSMSLPLCHFLYVTSSMSLPLCHFLYVTSSMSLLLCLTNVVSLRRNAFTVMMATQNGAKRKHDEVDGGAASRTSSVATYVTQRQSMLDISMVKLQNSPTRKEPSLRRSVLIFNTLRRIETELQQEGIKLHPNAKASLLPSIESGDDVTLDSIPSVENKPSHCHQGAPPVLNGVAAISAAALNSRTCGDSSMEISVTVTGGESLGYPGAVSPVSTDDASTSASTSTPLCMSGDMFCTAESKCLLDSLLSSDRLTVSSFTSMFEYDATNHSTSTTTNSSGSCGSHMPSSYSNGGYIGATGSMTVANGATQNSVAFSSTGKTDVDIFADLDMSLFDHDFFAPLASNMKLTQLNAEELVQTLPTSDTFIGSGTTTSSCNYKNDLLGDDLDHIMQVLVGN